MNLRGRTALVTGAAGHLGQVICETLAELGASIVLVDLPGSKVNERAQDINARLKVPTFSFESDIGLKDHRNILISSYFSKFNQLDIVVNNAAYVGTSKLEGWATKFSDQSPDLWGQVLEVNLTSAFDIVQKLTPLLNKSSGASVINIASIYGEQGPDWSLYEGTGMANPAAYSVSKGGLIQLTKWLATTLAPKIRVNTISPGGIYRSQPKEFVDQYISRTPMARMASENDIKGAIGYLASDLSRYVTGENLHVDGGWTVW